MIDGVIGDDGDGGAGQGRWHENRVIDGVIRDVGDGGTGRGGLGHQWVA